MQTALDAGDILIFRDRTTYEILDMYICVTSKAIAANKDAYIAGISTSGEYFRKTFRSHISEIPTGSKTECLFFDWSEAERSKIEQLLLELPIKECGIFDEWIVEEGIVEPNDAMTLWWWQMWNKQLFRQMCLINYIYSKTIHTACIDTIFDWKRMFPEIFEEWIKRLQRYSEIGTKNRQ